MPSGSTDTLASGPAPLWTPSAARAESAASARLRKEFNARLGLACKNYREFHAASIEHRAEFWSLVWDDCGLVGDKGKGGNGKLQLLENDAMPGARFFPEARLNYAENLLKFGGDGDALIFRGEDKVRSRLSWDELKRMVSSLQQWLASKGVREGDRVAAMLPNMPETIALLLAASSLGAVFSSCSPDFGPRGVLDRFGQIEPKVFVGVDGYFYAAKRLQTGDKVREVVSQLPSVEQVLIVNYIGEAEKVAASLPKNGTSFESAVAEFEPKELVFNRLPFQHPLYILFSSGTRVFTAHARMTCSTETNIHSCCCVQHGDPEMHRALGRRFPHPTRQGTRIPNRSPPKRPRLLFRYLRCVSPFFLSQLAGQVVSRLTLLVRWYVAGQDG